ncbi:membrane protein [Prauserella halophila]|uniref:Membrane protein n=1 Tax=Prauserella halophila TaxID=185641 RepID=A0ABN1WIQ6_9PSEU|nr:hypothetical protein [Prauserella halophila]MCP2237111.1 hypothetical protein [Prauserella halophila]
MTATSAGSGGWFTRACRRIHPGRNPLARSGDRWDGRLLVMIVVLAVATVPAAVTWGGDVHAGRLGEAARDAAATHRVTAVLTADAPTSATTGHLRGGVHVPARWTAPDGGERTGTVSAYRGATRGSEVTIWVDRAGAVTAAPATRTGAVVDGVSAGLALWLGVLTACGLGYAMFRLLLARSRRARWDREWERVAPDWVR